MSEYITISEFAKLAGVSSQSVYKRLSTQLSTYIQLVDNKKMLKISALKDIYGVEVDNLLNQDLNPLENTILSTIELLKVQLTEKDQQLQEKDIQIRELNKRLSEAHQMASNSQDLHKADKVQQVILSDISSESRKEKNKGIFNKLFKR